MAVNSILGFWKFKWNRIRTESGDWYEEKLFGGTMAISEKQLCLFVRSEQGSWGYTGTYTYDGKTMKILVEASTVEDIEGTAITREIKFINENELIFSGTEPSTERPFEVHYVRA